MRLMIEVDLKLSKSCQTLHEMAMWEHDDYYLEHLKDVFAAEAERYLRSKADVLVNRAFTEVREVMDEMAREEALEQGVNK